MRRGILTHTCCEAFQHGIPAVKKWRGREKTFNGQIHKQEETQKEGMLPDWFIEEKKATQGRQNPVVRAKCNATTRAPPSFVYAHLGGAHHE